MPQETSTERTLVAEPAAEVEGLGPSWAFVLFPLLTCVRQNNYLHLAGLLALCVIALRGRPQQGDRLRRYMPIALLSGVAMLSFTRGGTFKEALGFLLAALAVILAGRRTDAAALVRSLVTGMSVYMVANIAGWVAGIQSPAAKVRVGLLENDHSLLGVRVIFPFVTSINEPAIVGAAFLAYAFVAWRRGQRLGWTGRVGVPAAVFIFMASGSRFPIIVVAVIVPVMLLLPRLARVAPTLALATVGLPYVYGSLKSLETAASNWIAAVPFLARGQSTTDLASGSSRATFWRIGLEFWHQFPIESQRWFGYGYNGHVRSGVVYDYFPGGPGFFLNSPAALTLHNSFLQEMFDTGYVGLGALILALWLIGRRFTRAGYLETSTLVAVLFATSAVEVYLVPTIQAIPLLLLLALSVADPVGPERDQNSTTI